MLRLKANVRLGSENIIASDLKTRKIFNHCSMKEPDLYYFEGTKMTPQA